MYFAVVYYLDEYPVAIDSFREKYDPRFQLVKPHLTFVFPVDAGLGQIKIIEHLEKVLNQKSSFKATFSGISRSWDNLVFLLTQQGTDRIVKLHDELYSDVLKPFLHPTIEYTPHVTLGAARSEEVLQEAKNLHIHFTTEVRTITLIKRENEASPVLWSKEFFLKSV